MTASHRIALFFFGIALVLVAPVLVTDPYFRSTLIVFGLYALLALSLQVAFGLAGIFSFGQAAFFGVGAYSCALLMGEAGLPFAVAVVLAVILSACFGLAFALTGLRVKGLYFAIATLVCAEIVRIAAINWPSLTRGSMGLSVPFPKFPFLPSMLGLFYLIGIALVMSMAAVWLVKNSATGRTLAAIRENEELAATVGVPVFRYQAGALAASGGLAGLAGALYAPFVGVISTEIFSPAYSALALLMVVVGGRGSIAGPVLGAFVFSVVTEVFRFASDLRMITFSLLLVACIILMPQGLAMPIAGFLRRLGRRAAHLQTKA